MDSRYDNGFSFAHERLDVARLACEVARWAARQVLPPARKHLQEQLLRAADSLWLNVAEGTGQPPGASRRSHLRIAQGSAAEVHAVLMLVELPEGGARKQDLRRIAAMLAKMQQT